MSITAPLVFIIGMSASFLGTLPFGPINLSVIETSINRNIKAALRFSLAAAVVEILQSFVALQFGVIIGTRLSEEPLTRILAVLLLFGVGLFFWLKTPKDFKIYGEGRKKNDFLRGLLVALMNPQAIPFWIFVLTYLKMSEMITLDTSLSIGLILSFLIGVSSGKMAALALFAQLGKKLQQRFGAADKFANKIIGGILIGTGLLEAAFLFS